jgi:hypothetical protein
MPDARNQFKGQGWSRKREEGWDRAFASHKISDETVETITATMRAYEAFLHGRAKDD